MPDSQRSTRKIIAGSRLTLNRLVLLKDTGPLLSLHIKLEEVALGLDKGVDVTKLLGDHLCAKLLDVKI